MAKDRAKKQKTKYVKKMEIATDKYEPKPINVKKVSITIVIISIIITTAVLVWGMVFGGFYYKSNATYAEKAYKKIFNASDEEEAKNNIEEISFYNSRVKSDALNIIQAIYSSGLNWDGIGGEYIITDYVYSPRPSDMINKIGNKDYVFSFDDTISFGSDIPEPKDKFPKYLSRQVIIIVID